MKLIWNVVILRLKTYDLYSMVLNNQSLFIIIGLLEISASKNTMRWDVWCFWQSRKGDLTREWGKYNIFSNHFFFSSSNNLVYLDNYLIWLYAYAS